MVIQKLPLRWNTKMVELIREYWWFLYTMLLAFKQPESRGRCDQKPLNHTWERVQFYSIEAVLTVLFVSGALNSTDYLKVGNWMNSWALFAFTFHMFFHRLMGHMKPYGVITVFAFLPLFYVKHRFYDLP